ncbi:MAG: LCP family protein [Solirubrobacteraceae bacterium]|jgi:LCP family protein required for cell wall assembly
MDDARPPSLWWGMWKRFLIAGVLIVLLTAGATATVALNTASDIAHEIFPAANQIHAPKGLVVPDYNGGPETYLILGSDRRAASKDVLDRTDPPHSDTILLVRFDPEQGETSVLSIPRDLLVNIKSQQGQYYPQEKINAAYTYGSMLDGARGSMVLAAETIEHEVFPTLKLNGIVDVNFAGFIKVVDTLGCVYVNVDHRYLHVNGEGGEEYSEINLQPGYQKLCYNNALSYVRYRHLDSDFVRVARQQDFLRDLREQISPEDVIGQLDTVAKAVGRAIVTAGFSSSADQLIQLAKLVGFSQSKPLRQVKFRVADANFPLKGQSFVTSTPELEQATLADFLNGAEKVSVPRASPSSPRGHGHHPAMPNAASLGLLPTPSSGEEELVKASAEVPFRVLYPSLQTAPASQQTVRAYTLRDNDNNLRHAYVVVWQQNTLGGYYDFEGTDWLNPPIVAHPTETRRIGDTDYRIFSDGSHIHTIAWREGQVVYWLTNTLLEDLSNAQMLAIARSAQPLH